MEQVVLVIHILIAAILVAVVLLQRSEGGALGIGGGSGGLVSARGAANMLTRATAILAGLFMLTSILLTVLAAGRSTPTSVLDVAPAVTEEPELPKVPEVPISDD
ncbi:MAG: preprotein translocase subunit SecG [Sphingomonadales bacterium]